MSKATAQDYYNQQAGDPDDGYITPDDAKASVGVIYDDMAAADTAAIATAVSEAMPRITGNPNGVRTGQPGDQVVQTDATTDVKGWIRWVKATGTGNTGWVAGPEADTGWRSLDATAFGVDTGKLTLGECRLRRVGWQVWLSFYGTKVGTTGGAIATVPSGFRPADADETYGQIRNFTSKADAGIVNVQTSGQVNWDSASLTAGDVYVNTMTFSVTNAWPSSLPGNPAVQAELQPAVETPGG
jgi:hypothetical protein